MLHPTYAPADGQRGSTPPTPSDATEDAAPRATRSRRARKRGQPEGLKPGAAGMPGEAADAGTAEEAAAVPASTSRRKRDEQGQPSRRITRIAPAKDPNAPIPQVPPPVRPARAKTRHFFALSLFFIMVAAPVGAISWYLYNRAVDQYASTLAFSVRHEEGPSASELLGGIANLGGTASSSDTDVLNEFIRSQDMVARVDARLDLRTIYSLPENDPLFALNPDASIEDLVSYWQRVVTIDYDSGQGLIELRALAFTPEDAQAISQAIFEESSAMINDLTAIAREDATRFARTELEAAVDRLRTARSELTLLRTRTQIVDPNADIQGQMGLLNTLQAQLAEALIDLDLLRETTRVSDPRIRQTEQRIAVIEKRIEEERAKFGIGGTTQSGEAYATLVGEYESLIVNREFAESAYLTALTNYDAASAEAARQSRYLAAHIQPTLAETAEFPKRTTIILVTALFCFMFWATVTLVYYSIKDRR